MPARSPACYLAPKSTHCKECRNALHLDGYNRLGRVAAAQRCVLRPQSGQSCGSNALHVHFCASHNHCPGAFDYRIRRSPFRSLCNRMSSRRTTSAIFRLSPPFVGADPGTISTFHIWTQGVSPFGASPERRELGKHFAHRVSYGRTWIDRERPLTSPDVVDPVVRPFATFPTDSPLIIRISGYKRRGQMGDGRCIPSPDDWSSRGFLRNYCGSFPH